MRAEIEIAAVVGRNQNEGLTVFFLNQFGKQTGFFIIGSNNERNDVAFGTVITPRIGK